MKLMSLPLFLLSILLHSPASFGTQYLADTHLFSQQLAQTGCCKARQSDKHPWVRNGMNYQQCEDTNNSDGDGIFKKSGKYWWDRAC